MPFPIINTPLFTDLARQQGMQNIQSLAGLQEMAMRQQSLADLMQKRQQEQTMREMFQKAAQGAINQPNMAELSRIGGNISDLTKYGPPTEQGMQTIGDLYTQAETMSKSGFDVGKFAENLISSGTPEGIKQGLEYKKMLDKESSNDYMSVGDLIFNKKTGQYLENPYRKPEKDTSLVSEWKIAKEQGFPGTILDYAKAKAQNVHIVNPPQPTAPVAIVGPDNQPMLVSREQAIGKTPWTGSSVQLDTKDIQSREKAYPKATLALKSVEDSTDNFIKDLENLKNHPGLNQITGIAAGRLPGLTAEGRAAKALYDKVMAKGGFSELQNMRNSSPTGGALGNVSDAEGKQLRASFAAIDRTQDAPDVQKAISDTVDQLKNTKQRVREAYDMTYSYKFGQGNQPELPSKQTQEITQNIPKVGEVVKGYVFLGGNPSDKNRWRKQ